MMLGKARILSFPLTHLINSIIQEHSCKILYVLLSKGCRQMDRQPASQPETDRWLVGWLVGCSGLTSLSTIFRSYHDRVWLRQGALNTHFYSAASLWCHAPDTWHDTIPNHIILTLGRLAIALSSKSWVPSKEQVIQLLTILVCHGLGPNSWPPRSREQTLYRLSYWGLYRQMARQPSSQ